MIFWHRMSCWLAAMVCAFAATFGQASEASSTPAPFDIGPLVTAGLLDPKAPLERRRELARQLIDAAERDKDPALFYYVGSLYRQGDVAGIAPFPQDLDRAREYLSRSALGGHIEAMGKLAVVELDAGNRFEANLWAQLYVHYTKANQIDPPTTSGYRKPGGHESLGAALLEQTRDGLAKAELPRLIERANAMIARYGVVIERYQATREQERSRLSPRLVNEGKPFHLSTLQMRNELGRKAASASAEYFVEFAADGSQRQLWPFDAWPNERIFRVLRPVILGFRAEPETASRGSAVVLMPVTYINPLYRLKQARGED